MWESPIQMITDDIVKDIVQKQGEWLMEAVHRVGVNIDKDELVKALMYDRDQYEKGYADGRWARDSEIVRCAECKWWRDSDHTCRMWGGASSRLAKDFCSQGESWESRFVTEKALEGWRHEYPNLEVIE